MSFCDYFSRKKRVVSEKNNKEQQINRLELTILCAKANNNIISYYERDKEELERMLLKEGYRLEKYL